MLQILAMLGDKWAVLVIGQLQGRTLRFGELQRAVRGISQRMLPLTLRGLERNGLVSRTVHATVPLRVEYRLTGTGVALLDSLAAVGRWGDAYRHEIDDSRRRYDAARP